MCWNLANQQDSNCCNGAKLPLMMLAMLFNGQPKLRCFHMYAIYRYISCIKINTTLWVCYIIVSITLFHTFSRMSLRVSEAEPYDELKEQLDGNADARLNCTALEPTADARATANAVTYGGGSNYGCILRMMLRSYGGCRDWGTKVSVKSHWSGLGSW